VFLYGHPEYYPRYGYEACFGFGKTKLNIEKLPEAEQNYGIAPVTEADTGWIHKLYQREIADVNFAMDWGERLESWTITGVNAQMWWTKDGQRAAYTVKRHTGNEGMILLAEDADTARQILFNWRVKTLEMHPKGWLARNALNTDWAESSSRLSLAGFAIEIEDGVLEHYKQAIKTDAEQVGFALFPLPFLAC
jgi:hypothetical protein